MPVLRLYSSRTAASRPGSRSTGVRRVCARVHHDVPAAVGLLANPCPRYDNYYYAFSHKFIKPKGLIVLRNVSRAGRDIFALPGPRIILMGSEKCPEIKHNGIYSVLQY